MSLCLHKSPQQYNVIGLRLNPTFNIESRRRSSISNRNKRVSSLFERSYVDIFWRFYMNAYLASVQFLKWPNRSLNSCTFCFPYFLLDWLYPLAPIPYSLPLIDNWPINCLRYMAPTHISRWYLFLQVHRIKFYKVPRLWPRMWREIRAQGQIQNHYNLYWTHKGTPCCAGRRDSYDGTEKDWNWVCGLGWQF